MSLRRSTACQAEPMVEQARAGAHRDGAAVGRDLRTRARRCRTAAGLRRDSVAFHRTLGSGPVSEVAHEVDERARGGAGDDVEAARVV